MRKVTPILIPLMMLALIALWARWPANQVVPRSLVAAEMQEVPSAPDASAPADAAAPGEPAVPPDNPFPNRSPAPGLEGGVNWLNTGGPISLKDLRGKVVLLDFWTYCCINCMHVLPDLHALEQEFPNELVVIGVHSAKFENEKDSEAIRDAILRYNIEHPVINDAEMVVWRKYGARAWPTLILIDPEGYYCGYVSGEGNRELLRTAIKKVIAFHASKGSLDRTPVQFDLERNREEATPLRFPGKVLADAPNNRLFISDSNHHRVVITDLDGKLLETIGSGRIGTADGDYTAAAFDHPQGLALDGDTLYVADTENHLIRKIDLEAKQVSTLAGTGEQAQFRAGGGPLRETSLNSPWDLLVHDGMLYVAMAGSHQIWAHTIGSKTIDVFAGSGLEDVRNGSHAKCALAQPSGLAADDAAMYVCDSEGSAIRRVPFATDQPVTTIAGTSDLPGGRSLFEFGDRDGIGSEARLQHPLGIAIDGKTLYVADSYNHKLKTIRLPEQNTEATGKNNGNNNGKNNENGEQTEQGPPPGTVETLAGSAAGDALDPVQFSEPAGLAIANGRLFIADTNNHRILTLKPGEEAAAELSIEGLQPPPSSELASSEADSGTSAAANADSPAATEVAALTAQAGQPLDVTVTLNLPAEYKLNTLAPLVVTASNPEGKALLAEGTSRRKATPADASGNQPTVTVTLPLAEKAGSGTITLSLQYGYCREGTGGLCKLGTARWKVPITLSDSGESRLNLTAQPAQ